MGRFFVNHAIEMEAQNVKIHHLLFFNSIHRPILAKISFTNHEKDRRAKHKILRFEEGWLKHKDSKKTLSRIFGPTAKGMRLNTSTTE